MRAYGRKTGGRVRAALAAGLTAAALGAALGGTQLAAAPQGTQIDAQRAQIRAIEAELVSIDAQASAAAADAAEASAKVEEAERSLARNAARLKQAKKDLVLSRRRLSERLVAIYREEPPTFVEVLLNSDGLSGAVDAQQQLDRVSEHDERVIRTVRQSRARLAEARAILSEQRKTAVAQRQAAAERRDALEGLIGQRRAVLEQARSTLGALLEAEERRQRLAAIAAAHQAEEERLRAVATDPGGSAPATSPSSPSAPATSPGGSSGSSPAVSGDLAGRLDRIAQCESGGNPRAISPGGTYRGKYQFHPDTWASLGGQGDPAAAPEAEQDRLAAILLRQSGSSPWPVCGA